MSTTPTRFGRAANCFRVAPATGAEKRGQLGLMLDHDQSRIVERERSTRTEDAELCSVSCRRAALVAIACSPFGSCDRDRSALWPQRVQRDREVEIARWARRRLADPPVVRWMQTTPASEVYGLGRRRSSRSAVVLRR